METQTPLEKAASLVDGFKENNKGNPAYTNDNAIKDAIEYADEMIIASGNDPQVLNFWQEVINELEDYS